MMWKCPYLKGILKCLQEFPEVLLLQEIFETEFRCRLKAVCNRKRKNLKTHFYFLLKCLNLVFQKLSLCLKMKINPARCFQLKNCNLRQFLWKRSVEFDSRRMK